MKHLLGGKGANLAEMCRLNIPVPAGFTITTEACTEYTRQGRDHVISLIREEVISGVKFLELEMGKQFGNNDDPRVGLLPPFCTDVWRCRDGSQAHVQRGGGSV
ncbi:MAG: hypothetical protein LW693_14985 [Saprospiraceae bacterium]|nr:hypothetical protein [Saprospiraceae bacterium]